MKNVSNYKEILRYAVVLGNEYDKIFGNNKPTIVEKIRITSRVEEIVEEVVFSMFFENLTKKGKYRIKTSHEEHIVTAIILFDKKFYTKHIGRLINEVREKEMRKMVRMLVEKIEKTDWMWIIKRRIRGLSYEYYTKRR